MFDPEDQLYNTGKPECSIQSHTKILNRTNRRRQAIFRPVNKNGQREHMGILIRKEHTSTDK